MTNATETVSPRGDPVHDDPAPADLPPPGLPGIRPLDPADWLRADGPFAARMALRARLVSARRDEVLALLPGTEPVADLALGRVLAFLSRHPAWRVGADRVRRPDGAEVALDRSDPLGTLAAAVQEDVLLMDRGPDGAHRLVGGVLCFPAGWTLSEKMGRPLAAIHGPVPAYDAALAGRVQRLFDGLHPDRPLVRSNDLAHPAPDLFQPRPEADPIDHSGARWRRRERQCLVALSGRGGPAAFTIRTYLEPIAPPAPGKGAR
ncbi:MAG: heme-dependent oxidative N-demethylase family protein [Hasllibacter sp.]